MIDWARKKERKYFDVLSMWANDVGSLTTPLKKWIGHPKKKWCIRIRQPLKELCMGVKQLLIEDLCVEVR